MIYDQQLVASYYQMMEEYNNDYIISKFRATIPPNKTVLELGFGTGKDYLQLKTDYKITPSDYSDAFITKFKQLYPDQVLKVNAELIDIDQNFDCIYSSKVLNSLTEENILKSLANQYIHLNKGGYIFHTLWYGDRQVDSSLVDKHLLKQIFELDYEYVQFEYYKEADFYDTEYDSVIVIARK